MKYKESMLTTGLAGLIDGFSAVLVILKSKKAAVAVAPVESMLSSGRKAIIQVLTRKNEAFTRNSIFFILHKLMYQSRLDQHLVSEWVKNFTVGEHQRTSTARATAGTLGQTETKSAGSSRD